MEIQPRSFWWLHLVSALFSYVVCVDFTCAVNIRVFDHDSPRLLSENVHRWSVVCLCGVPDAEEWHSHQSYEQYKRSGLINIGVASEARVVRETSCLFDVIGDKLPVLRRQWSLALLLCVWKHAWCHCAMRLTPAASFPTRNV